MRWIGHASGVEPASAIERLVACTNGSFVRWVLALDAVERPSESHEAVAKQLLGVTEGLPVSTQPDVLGRAVVASYALAADPPTIGLLNSVRAGLGGTIAPPPVEEDAFAQVMTQLAVAAYPELLVLVAQPPGPWHVGVNCLTARHGPLGHEAALLARAEVDRKDLRPADTEYEEFCVLFRSTGSGGGESFDLIPACLLGSAAAKAVLDEGLGFSLSAFLQAVHVSVEELRRALVAKHATVGAAVWLAGVTLPEGALVDAGAVTISRGDEDLCRLYNDFRPPGLTAASPSDGCLLRAELPYSVTLQSVAENVTPTVWPSTATLTSLHEVVQRVRAALLLATDEAVLAGEPAWGFFLEPLGSSHSQPYPIPTQPVRTLRLNEGEVARWRRALGALERHADGDHLRVALSRLRSAAEPGRRRDDAIIDAMICLEALFGARSDSTLRVTGSVARLLGTDLESRRELKRRVADLYALRSAIVHGADVDHAKVADGSSEAVRIAREVVAAILDRDELVRLPSSERSNRLLVFDA